MGDYQATVFSEYSHNRRFGEAFVRGEPYGELAEGVATTTALLRLCDLYGVEMPICRAVNAVVNCGEDPDQVLLDLFGAQLKERILAELLGFVDKFGIYYYNKERPYQNGRIFPLRGSG